MTKKFPVLEPEIPEMVGRKNLLKKVLDNFEKQKPDNLSVIGPKYTGKSVFAKALGSELVKTQRLVVFWDLKSDLPVDFDDFCLKLGRKLVCDLPHDNDYRNHFETL